VAECGSGCGAAARRAFTLYDVARVRPIKGRRARAFANGGMLLITVRIIIINNNNNSNSNRSKSATPAQDGTPWYPRRVASTRRR